MSKEVPPPRLRLLTRVAQVGPAAFRTKDAWVSQPLDSRWIAAYRLVRSGGKVRIGEVRIFPLESGYRNNGEWSAEYRGFDSEAPRAGLTKSVLMKARPHTWLALGALAAGGQPYSTGREFKRVFGPPPPDPPKRGSGPGRPGHADLFLARVARDYARAIQKKEAPVDAIAKAHEAPVARVRGWVHKARQRGFLSLSTQGKAMGQLTAKGQFVLESRGKR